MSLKSFHMVFITLSVFLLAGLAVWGFQNNRSLAVAGVIGLALLIPYGLWFFGKIKKIAPGLAAITFLSWSPPVLACTVCFGDPSSLMTKGIKAGIIALILTVGIVLGTILGFALAWSRRASKKIQKASEH